MCAWEGLVCVWFWHVITLIYGVVRFFSLCCVPVSERGWKGRFQVPCGLLHVCENKVPGPWDKQLQEWLSDTWLHPDAFHTGIYRNEECIEGSLNVNKYHKAFERKKAVRKIKIIVWCSTEVSFVQQVGAYACRDSTWQTGGELETSQSNRDQITEWLEPRLCFGDV